METTRWRPPLAWRAMLVLARIVAIPLCRLRVTGTVPAELRGRPLILAANHISPFDPVAMTAACHKAGIAPRVMAAGGISDALPTAAEALEAGAMVLIYPEGRIGLDPSMWPERGKTGVARMAAA